MIGDHLSAITYDCIIRRATARLQEDVSLAPQVRVLVLDANLGVLNVDFADDAGTTSASVPLRGTTT
jgi:hypothetical protein